MPFWAVTPLEYFFRKQSTVTMTKPTKRVECYDYCSLLLSRLIRVYHYTIRLEQISVTLDCRFRRTQFCTVQGNSVFQNRWPHKSLDVFFLLVILHKMLEWLRARRGRDTLFPLEMIFTLKTSCIQAGTKVIIKSYFERLWLWWEQSEDDDVTWRESWFNDFVVVKCESGG